MALRARHPEEIRKANGVLQIGEFRIFVASSGCCSRLYTDYEYYITNQILPPIERLCEPIEGTDRSRIAHQQVSWIHVTFPLLS